MLFRKSVVFLFCMNICVCECLLKNNIAGVPSSRTTSGFPQYCVFICVRFGCTQHASLWIPNQRRKTKFAIYSMVHCGRAFDPGASGFLITASPSVCVPEVIGVLAMRILKQNKKNAMLVRTWFVPLPVYDHSQGIYYFPLNTGGGVPFFGYYSSKQTTNEQMILLRNSSSR